MIMMLRLLAMALLVAAQPAPDPHRPVPSYDKVAPSLPPRLHDAVLIVSKTNAFRHAEAIPHANQVLARIAREQGRQSFVTENGAVFNDKQLRHFSLVILDNASGDFLTPDQLEAFARFVERGGGVVALHASGDNSHVAPWYVDTIIGTHFIGHPGGADQFQTAKVIPAAPDHPIMKGVKLPWAPRDEWYSFTGSPAQKGMTVLARIDEQSYRPGKIAMGADHPVIWINPNMRGRIVYSALGHTPEAYDDPNYRLILRNAIRWAAAPRAVPIRLNRKPL